MMEKCVPTCLLLVAGMLSLAGTSPDSADQSLLRGGPVTAGLVSVGEEATEVTLQFDRLTSVLANEGISRLHEVSGMEAEGITKYSVTIPENPELSFSEGVILGHQSKVPLTNKPLVTSSVSKSKSISSRPKHLTTFLPRKEEMENDTVQELSRSVKQFTSIPGKTDAMDQLVTTLPDSGPPEKTGQRVALATSLSLATATGNLPTFPLVENRTELGGHPTETMQMPAKLEREKLLTLIPKASESSQVKSAQPTLHVRTSDIARTTGLLTEVPGPSIKGSSAVISWQPLSEEHTEAIPRTIVEHRVSSLASTPHGGIREHETTVLSIIKSPAFLTPQSNTYPFPSLSTPETPPSESSPQPAKLGGFPQSILSEHLSPSLFPLSSKSGPSSLGEELLHEVLNSVSHHEIDLQTTAQSSHFKLSQTAGALRGSLPLPNLKGATTKDWPKASFPGHSEPQPPGVLPLVYSKPWVSMPSTSLLDQSASFHAGPTVTSRTTSSHVESPSPVRTTAVPAGHITEGTYEFQPSNIFSTVHKEQTSPSTFLPSHIESEPLAFSSSSAQTRLQTTGFHARSMGPVAVVPSQAEPQHEPEELSIVTTALARTKPPILGSFSSLYAEPNTLVVTGLAHSEPKQPGLSTVVHDELQERTLGPFVSFQVKQLMADNSVSTYTRPATSPVEPDVVLATSGTSSTAGLSIPGTSFLHHTKPELSPNILIPSNSKTPSPLAQVFTSLQPSSIDPPAQGEQKVISPSLNVSSHAKLQVPPGDSAIFTGESGLLVIPVPAHAKPKTNETLVDRRPPVLIDAKPPRAGASASTPAKAWSLALSAHPHVEHQSSDVSAKPGTQPLLQTETQTPKTNSSATVQLHSFEVTIPRHLKARTPSTSAYVNTESPTPETFPLAGAGTQIPSILTSVPPAFQTKATTLLPVTSHTLGKQSERRDSLQTSLPTHQDGTARTSLQGVSTSLFSRRSPIVDSPIPSISHHSNINVPLLSPADTEENIHDLKTTSMLVGAGAQNLMQSSLGFIQHFKQSDGLTAGSLDSLLASGYLGTSPSLQYLSLFVRNAENMVCLQPMQNTTPSSGEPSASTQEMLFLSSALGFSHLSASRLIQMGPSSAILVNPVLLFLPADKPKGPVLRSMGKEGEHEARLSFTNKAVLGLVMSGSSQEQLVKMSPPTLSTILHPARPNTLSANTYLSDKQVISGPVLTTFPRYTEVGLVRSNNFTANPFPRQLRELSTGTKYLQTKNHDKGSKASTLNSQELEKNNPVPLSVGTSAKHHLSAAPPATVPVLKRSQTLPPPTEQLIAVSKTSPLPSLLEPLAPRMLRSSLPRPGTAGKPRLSTMQICHTEEHPRRSMTLITPLHKNFGGPLSTFSAGNMKLPLEMRHHLTPPRGSLSTQLLGRTLSKVHYVPNTVSNVLSLSTGKEHKASVALNDPSPEAAAAFPMATEMSSCCTNTTFAKPFPFYRMSPKPPMANEKLRALPSFALFSVDAPARMTLPGKQFEGVKKPQVHPGPSANMSSQVSRYFHFAKLVVKYNPATQMHSGKLSLASAAEQLEPTANKGESDQRSGGTEMYNPAEATSFVPTVPSTNSGLPSAWLAATDFRSTSTAPYDVEESIDLQRLFHVPPLHTIHSFAPGPTLKDTTVSSVGGEAALLETPHSGLNRLQLRISGTSEDVFFSPSANKVQLLKPRRGETESTASHFHPEPASLKQEHLERPKLLDVEWAWKVGSSLPPSSSSSSSSSSSVLSVVPHAPTFLMTTLARLAGGPVRRVLPLGISERSLQSQVQPTPGNLSDISTMSAGGDATSSPGKFNESLLDSVEEQVAVTTSPAGDGDRQEAGEEQQQDARWDSDSSLLDWRVHARRLLHSNDDPLVGYAVVSDDACNSGNYSTEMSLRPAATANSASPPDSFLARIVLQDNRSRPALHIRSVAECRHIQVHQNSQSQAANFTIQLFQMLNHSVVYLHCKLSVCPGDHAGCGQSCMESRETSFKPSNRSSYETHHNVISFGPVLRAQTVFPPGPAAGSQVTRMFLAFLISLIGMAVLTGTLTFLWFCQRSQPKMATKLEQKGTGTP